MLLRRPHTFTICSHYCSSTFSGTYSIVAGSISLDPLSETAQTRTVLRVFSHENYDTDTLENDIALLKLDARLDLSGPSVRAICIPGSDAAVGTACTISGWGNTDTGKHYNDVTMMTSWYGYPFHINSHLWGKSNPAVARFHSQRANGAELWRVLAWISC